MAGVRVGIVMAFAGATAAVGSTPAPSLFGVERVVIACEADASVTASERAAICAQLVKKAQAVTALPVRVATDADLDGVSGDIRRQSNQLLLKISAHAEPVEQGRKQLALTIQPLRLARGGMTFEPLQSTATLLKVRNDWVVQGPISAFQTLLAGPASGLRAPTTSDR